MSVTGEILRTYRTPRQVMRRLLASASGDDRPEARSLVYLLAGCFVIFVAQIPGLLNADLTAPDAPPREALLGITFFSWMFVWPLFFYVLAALGHLAAKLVGGQGSFARARTTFSWVVLAVSPLMLLRAVALSMAGPDASLFVVDALVALAFCVIWLISLIEAERP